MAGAERDLTPGTGFPRGVEFTPVPNPLLASLLEKIDDLSELKLTLRVIWALHQKRGNVRTVTAAEMCADRTVAAMLGMTGVELEHEVTRALGLAVGRGTLLTSGEHYLLNTAQNRAALERGAVPVAGDEGSETRQAPDPGPGTAAVFTLYEENVGPLTPLIGERISTAIAEFGEAAVRDAIRIAVEANVRNWSYVAAVLRRMADQGMLGGKDGEPGGDTAEDRDAFIRQYLDRQRRRGNN